MSEDELHQQYTDLFGTSEEQLREQGIDPREHAMEKLRLAREGKVALGPLSGPMPDFLDYRSDYVTWGLRGYTAMFVTLGFLALSKVHALHLFGLAAACTTFVAAFWMVTKSLVSRRKYVVACRRAGVKPYWRTARRRR
jgi:hypothetical protein